MGTGIEPFRIDIEQAQLDDLQVRLKMARIPDQLPGVGWEAGIHYDYMRELIAYWRDEYDWRAQERRLNDFDHFRTMIDGQTIHFIHQRSPDPDAFPLLLLHGWPGSIVEFLNVIDLLGGTGYEHDVPAPGFHLVVPSLPGYGFSSPLKEPGWTLQRIAQAFAELMANLGYDRYGVQGGDWGAMITHNMALIDDAHVAAIHINMPIASLEATPDMSEAERKGLDRTIAFQRTGAGYGAIQGTKPQTIGLALDNSPVGLCGWIVEKFHGWSDVGEDFNAAFTKDELLTNVMLYWLTGTAMSAARLYYETAQVLGAAGAPPASDRRVEIPTGIARFAFEIFQPPRARVEAGFNVVHWSDFPSGGHFAALEEPELLAADIRAFFAAYREPGATTGGRSR